MDPTAPITVTGQSVTLDVTGQPDVKNKYGSGHIRPRFVRVDYRGQAIHAQVYGSWIREDGELTDHPCDQDYQAPTGDVRDWPDWLAALAYLAKGAAPAVTSPLTDPCTCRVNPALTAQIGYPVRCPHCPPGADAIPPTHWTKHVQLHHLEAASAEVSPPPSRTELRDRIATAARAVPLRLGPNAVGMAQRGEPIILNMSEADDLAAAVLAVLPEPTSRAAEGRLLCPQCGEDVTDYGEDDHVYRTGDDRPFCSGECVVAAHRSAGQRVSAADRAALLLDVAGFAERLMDERYGPDCAYAIGGRDVARELRRLAAKGDGAGTQQQDETRCAHGCDISRCPCLACEAAADEEQQHTADFIAPCCDGFPATCPNPVNVPPGEHHDGGIRCGCYDKTQPTREA